MGSERAGWGEAVVARGSGKILSLNKFHFLSHIGDCSGLEGTLQIIQLQPPCREQGHLPPDQVAESPVQPGLEHCQGGGSHSFSGQPVPVPHHPHGKEFHPNIESKSDVFQFKAIPPCPVTTCPCKKLLSSFLTGPF